MTEPPVELSVGDLGELADPARRRDPLELGDEDAGTLRAWLRRMILIRRTEEVVGDLVAEGEIQCPCHLAIGQEACSVGVASAVDPERDRVFGGHRSHAQYLALGGEVDGLLAEVFGKATGCSGGMGGSMHLTAPERGLAGTVPIVGATVPIAAGAAWAAKMDGDGGVGVSFFGDGATEEGVVQETLNLASKHELPVVFACENNLFSSHLHIGLRQPSDGVSRFAEAHRLPHRRVDGNDVVAVARVAREAIARAREGGGPTFLEMVTYRWRGHVGPREDLDVGVRRSGDLPAWKERDPVRRLAEALRARGELDEGAVEAMGEEAEASVRRAVDRAREAPYPDADATTRYLYTDRIAGDGGGGEAGPGGDGADETVRTTYGKAIRAAHAHLLDGHPEVFVLGQGLWSPWYVGDSMTELEVEYGKDRVVDTPVSEQACTGAAVGAAVAGRRPIVVHPRMDFMVLASDQIVSQAAKWSSMFAREGSVPVVIRGIINRGGEQGAQHSQALHAWYAHVPGLRVVMPWSVADARDLLVSAVLSDDPVLYVDDRWLYQEEAEIPAEPDPRAVFRGARVVRSGSDVTLAAAGYSTSLALEAADELAADGIEAEVVDLRVLNPLDRDTVAASVGRTGRLVAVDGGWSSCGLAAEVIAAAAERLEPGELAAPPARVTLQDAPAPTSGPLEEAYYPDASDVSAAARRTLEGGAGRSGP